MDHIHRLSALFAQFPGIGGRQSKRFVYFLLKQDKAYVHELVSLIESLEASVLECTRCHRYFMKKHTESSLCFTCADGARDHTLLMVVEKDADLEAVEKSGMYRGTYFILGGTLPLLEKAPMAKIRVNALVALLGREARTLKEIILAAAVTPESEHTTEYVRSAITPLCETNNIRITELGRGLSTGTELEYSDADTLKYALLGRK